MKWVATTALGRVIGAVTSSPIRSVTLGAAVLTAIGWIGKWYLVLVFTLAAVDFVWCMMRLPVRWRPW